MFLPLQVGVFVSMSIRNQISDKSSNSWCPLVSISIHVLCDTLNGLDLRPYCLGSLQVNVFVSMSAALRQMCGAMWPGLGNEGVWWFTDLTQPAVDIASLATPFGVCGLFMPLAIFAGYLQAVERSPIGKKGMANVWSLSALLKS